MDIVSRAADLYQWLDKNTADSVVGFVPTMGALHNGHMSLIERARSECDIVIVSIFVNPTQFNDSSDLETYPRTPEKDRELLLEHGCDLLFSPDEHTIYPKGYEPTNVDLGSLDSVLEGAFRPGHFKGVSMVVERLFQLVKPHKAYFGLKDYQQVMVIRKMTEQCGFRTDIVACPVIREESGLAMSSRNDRLSLSERESAAEIHKALNAVKKALMANMDRSDAIDIGINHLLANRIDIEYLEVRHRDDLENKSPEPANAIILFAGYIGGVRLIDNLLINE